MAESVLGRIKVVLSADTSNLVIGLDKATRNVAQFGDNATRVGRTLTTRLTLPIAGLGAAAIKTAAGFEQSMSKITALVGVAADEVKAMEGTVRSMAVEFGKSGKDAADALFFITSAGLRGSVATDTLAASLKASAIGLGETATIADLATSALNAYGADVLSASEATDVLAAAVREGKLEAGELAGSMGRVLPLASAMGVSFNEVGAAFAALSRTGTNAAEAATQVRGILSSLLRPTKQAEEALEGMGLSSEGLRQQLQEEGLLATLKTLANEFGNNEAAAASVFGNIRALSGVLDLMGANVATTEAIFASMADTTGAVDNAFGVMSETASFQFQQAMAEVKDSLLTLGQELMPIVTDATQVLTDAIRGVTGFFADMDDSTKQALAALAGVAAIAGPVALGIGAISKALVALRAANPWVLALTTAVSGLAIIMSQFQAEARKTEERAKALTDEFRAAGEPIDNLIPKLQDLAGQIKNLLPDNAAEQFEKQMEQIAGSATLLGELEAVGVDTSVLDEIGVSIDDLVGYVRQGSDEATAFTDVLERFSKMDGAGGVVRTLSEVVAGLGRELTPTEQAIVDFIEANEDSIAVAGQLVDALGNVNTAFRKVIDDGEAASETYINSGEVFRDLAGVLSDDYIRSLLASGEAAATAAGRTDTHTASLEYVEKAVQAELDALNEVQAMTVDVTRSTSGLTDANSLLAQSAEDQARALVNAANAADYDTDKIRELLTQMGLLDKLDPEIIIELGIEVSGGQSLDEAIRGLEDFYSQLAADIGMALPTVPAALQSLYDLRDALNTPSGGGGGGGGVANEIDEVARAAEEAQAQVDRFAQSVQRLGDDLVGRDFAVSLLGATPDEIVEEFRNIATQAMALAEVAAELGLPGGPEFLQQIAAIGDAFDQLAEKSAEVAAAQEELADAEGVLASLQGQVAMLEDQYAAWRDEVDGVNTAQERLNAALDSYSDASRAYDDARKALEEMAQAQQDFLNEGKVVDGTSPIADQLEAELQGFRDAQAELDKLKSERQTFEQSTREMFNVRLSPDTNVMGQTQRLVAQARELRDNITALKDRGFPADVLQQVAQAGLSGGAKLSRHLLRLSQGDLAEFLAMRAEISSIGGQVASIAGEVIFGADVAGAEDRLNEQRSLVENLYQQAVDEARVLQEEAQLAMEVERAAVEAAFEAAIAEADAKVEEQKQIVEDLKEALEASQQEMADLIYAIQNDLATAFTTFLSGLGSHITSLTTTPALLDVNVSPTESLSSIVSSLETLIEQAGAGATIGIGEPAPEPAPAPAPGGGGGGGGGSAARTYTVASGDSLWGIAQSLLGSGTRWRDIARANGRDPAGYGSSWAIHAGDVLQIPARAMGGSVAGRRPYLVGELGPELFVPNASGSIVPNHALGGGGDTFNITVNMPTGANGEDVVRAIEKYTRRRGAVAVPTTNRRRF